MANVLRTYKRYGTVTDTITLPVNPDYNQLFLAVKYFSAATFAEAEAVTPSGGTIAGFGRPNGAGGYSILFNSESEGNPLDCTETSHVLSTNTPLDSIRCTPDSITGATHYCITITAKES